MISSMDTKARAFGAPISLIIGLSVILSGCTARIAILDDYVISNRTESSPSQHSVHE